ncbi:MAG: signal peptide peptidase SppA, partial [Halieaceae bacterium]|nr:signal peptide peptidase SppA [Halieaceae bacterium]
MSKPSKIKSFISALWHGITLIRLALSNILFLLLLGVIYFVYLGGGPEPLPERAALLLNPVGTIVDQKSPVEPLSALVGEPSPADHQVLLRDVIEAIEYAEDDSAITALVMELDSLLSVGISKSMEIGRAIESFKRSGKPVIAVGDNFSQGQYLLASYADKIVLHPFGGVELEGYSSYRNYYADALDKISVTMHVFKAGEHKSIAEPFLRNNMSPAEKDITGRWLEVLWAQFTELVEGGRDLPDGAVNDYIDNFVGALKVNGGDLARVSLEAGLVDELMGRQQANASLIELVGGANDDGLYEAVGFERYVSRKRPMSLPGMSQNKVAVITAQGTIQNGEEPPGSIGGDSLGRLIRTTAEEEGVSAIVLRVNSGGGGVFASEVIRQEVRNAKAKGLPVVVSMGAVAASGGYYIAADADQIWATPATITGSIGV